MSSPPPVAAAPGEGWDEGRKRGRERERGREKERKGGWVGLKI